jgi:ribosomal protein S18 acetylase RimI-like enzyme
MRIRLARPGDARAIAAFNAAMALETEGKRLFAEVIGAGVRALLRRPKAGFYLLAETKAEIAGVLMITTEWSDWRNGAFWWIQSVYVRPEFRRQGVYRRLYRHVQGLAKKDRRVCGFRLYVERENRRAQATYRALGMEKTRYLVFEELKPGVRFYR